jgi:hypothetical protein
VKPRELFLEACRDIAAALSGEGFRTLARGQSLKRTSPNRDLTYEIYFQSSSHNDASSITMLPHLTIRSKAVKKWWSEQHPDQRPDDLVFTGQLGYLSSGESWTSWNVSPANRSAAIQEISELLLEFGIPIFRLFDDVPGAILHLRTQGASFNPHMKNDSLAPLPFVLGFGTQDDAQAFFRLHVEACTYAHRIFELYESLANASKIDLSYSEFHQADNVKLAYLHGLTPRDKTG